MADELLPRLAEVVGAEHVLASPDVRAAAEVDWTGRWRGRARAVVRPGSTREVAGVVAACVDAGAAVVTQGGNTGLVGGSVPHAGAGADGTDAARTGAGAVVVATTRLDAIGEVEPAHGQVRVGAGATLAAVQAHARPHGLAVGVDLAARDTATVGGMAATNAGGVHVVAHGMMRAQVAGLVVVLADGAILDERRGLTKDNTGYDLVGLMVGSEGTLGVITEVTLRLVSEPSARAVALVPGVSLAEAVAALPRIRAAPGLRALEWVDEATAGLVATHGRLERPVGPGPWLLVELAGAGDLLEPLAAALADLEERDAAAVAVEPGDRAALWAHREAATEAIATEAAASGPPVRKLDVAVPPASLPELAAALPDAVAATAPGARVAGFGHIGDGNLHVQLLDADDAHAEPAEDAVLERVVAAGGSISAEHGIGVVKRRWLERARSPEAVAALRAIKRAFDPHGRLNPGVLVDP